MIRTNDGSLDEVTVRIDVWHTATTPARRSSRNWPLRLDQADFPLAGGGRVVEMRRTTESASQEDDGIWKRSIEFLVEFIFPRV